MKKWPPFCLFLCYPLMPVAFVCGFGFYNTSPIALVSAFYYLLLLTSLWHCGRFEGWAGRFYRLAGLLVAAHVAAVGAPIALKEGPTGFIPFILLSIFGVFLLATWAGAALAWRLRLGPHAALQLVAPFLLLLPMLWRLPQPLPNILLLSIYGGQGLHALSLALRVLDADKPREKSHPGLNPSD